MSADPNFTLTADAITAINALPTMYFTARTVGIIGADLDSTLAGNAFILRLQQRLMLLMILMSRTYGTSFNDA